MSGIKRSIETDWHQYQNDIELHWMEQEYYSGIKPQEDSFIVSQGTRIRELINRVSELENKIITLETKLDIAKTRIKVCTEVIKDYSELLQQYKKMLNKDGE